MTETTMLGARRPPARIIGGLMVWLVSGLIAAAAGGASAEAASITLAWDSSPQSDVVGYRVYIGLQPGVYTETYDAGAQTTFKFSRAAEGQTYHVAVAAYSTSGTGPLSKEIAVTVRAEPRIQPTSSGPARVASAPTDTESSSPAACGEGSPDDCHSAPFLPDGLSPIGALTALPDGRLFFIQSSRYVRVIEGSTIAPEPALTAGRGARLSGLAVDPAFERTRHIFVGEISARPDGSRELTIVRYRELGGGLGEGAAVISGVALPPSGEAPFTLDNDGRLYIAIPAPASGERAVPGAYHARILRFAADGTIGDVNRAGSPEFALGYAQPSDLVWDPAGQLWAAGVSTGWPSLVRLDVDAQSPAAWPLVPHTVHVSGPATSQPIERIALVPARKEGHLPLTAFVVDAEGALNRLLIERGATARAVALETYDHVVEVAVGADQNVYVIVQIQAASPGAGLFRMLRIVPR